MSENLLGWEEEYKRKRVMNIRESVIDDVRKELEFKYEEKLEKERIIM